MKNGKIALSVIALFAVLVLFAVSTISAQEEAVYFVPRDSTIEGGQGNTIDIEVWVKTSSEFDSWQTDIAFVPACVNITDVTYPATGDWLMSSIGFGHFGDCITMSNMRAVAASGYPELLAMLTVHCEASDCTSPLAFTGTYFVRKEDTEIALDWIDGNVTNPPMDGNVTRIEVTPSTKELTVGNTWQFTATAYNQYDKVMSDVLLTWTSSHTAVGTVSPTSATTGSDGKATTTFTASTAGTATVTAAHGTVSGTASVTVLNVPHAMCKDVDQSGNPIKITANFSTSDAYAVSWVELEDIGVGDPSLTTEEWAWRLPNGSLYPSQFTTRKWCEVREGVVQKCTFTAFMKIAGCPPANIPGNWHVDFYYDDEKQFTETFTISSGESVVTTITVTPSTVTLNVRETQQLTATAYNQYDDVMSDIPITWTSSNTAAGIVNQTSAATGSDGKATTTFTASASGTTTVTAAHGTVSGTASVTVLKPNGDSVCKIAFSSMREGNDTEIYVMDADGTNVKKLTSYSAICLAPAWSPDGSKIAFSSDRDGDFEIYVMDADGTNVKQLTNNTVYDWYPDWCCSVPPKQPIFDTGEPTPHYPSIFGAHHGTLTPDLTFTVQKLYSYPCAGTGGHTNYARLWNDTWSGKEAYWGGYEGDWHNVTFDEPFTLFAKREYHYEIKTGSYPKMHNTKTLQTTNGWINCTSFTDVNGKTFTDRIPAIKLAGIPAPEH